MRNEPRAAHDLFLRKKRLMSSLTLGQNMIEPRSLECEVTTLPALKRPRLALVKSLVKTERFLPTQQSNTYWLDHVHIIIALKNYNVENVHASLPSLVGKSLLRSCRNLSRWFAKPLPKP